ncbi:MAG: hypothetical protein OXC54_03045 [Rhodospirillaceae bacterium]|nr:hypothetical protein [Rhodospirillaceae bacterium]MCY4310278.1 hypothetical protein [Rhodospirillaceae bacterium]
MQSCPAKALVDKWRRTGGEKPVDTSDGARTRGAHGCKNDGYWLDERNDPLFRQDGYYLKGG